MILQKYQLDHLLHIHIWQVPLQQSCIDTSQKWKQYSLDDQSFDNSGK